MTEAYSTSAIALEVTQIVAAVVVADQLTEAYVDNLKSAQ